MRKLMIIAVLSLLALTSMAQNVTNARFVQDGKVVKIYYDLSEEADVSVYLSTDGGKTFDASPIKHVIGDVGASVPAGNSRCAIWDVLSDQEFLQCNNTSFKIIAEICDTAECNRKGDMFNKNQNYREAVRWYKKSAEHGSAKGQYCLSNMYFRGNGVRQDYQEAVMWLRMSAEKGYIDAELKLAYLLCEGLYDVISIDYTEAMKWYQRAVEQGSSRALCNIGWMYEVGLGVNQDNGEALKWYLLSAEQGNATAQFNVGLMYEYGKGVESNREEALRWYRKSAALGNNSAKEKLQR